jgi:hypothetical protein
MWDIVYLFVYRVIQSAHTILKEGAGEIIWSRKYLINNFFSDSPPFPNYDALTLMSVFIV